MPKIHILTNIVLRDEQTQDIKTRLGQAVETLPGKSERWLMVQIEDGAKLFFQGSEAPCLMASVELFGSVSDDVYDQMTALLTDTLSQALAIPPARIYTQYTEFRHWGWNGRNF